MRTLAELPGFDIFDAGYQLDPMPLAEAPRTDWCATDALHSYLFVQDHEQVVAMLAHHDLRAATVEESSLGELTSGPAVEWTRRIPSFCDGPSHRHMRSAIGPAFSSRAVEPFRETIADIAARLVARIESGRTELVEEVCFALPRDVFAALLGADPSRFDSLRDAVSTVSRVFSFDAGNARVAIEAGLADLSDLATDLRRCPQGVVARIEEIDLDDDVRQALVVQSIVAGWETTASQSACMLYAMSGTPERWELTTAEAIPVSAVVDEALRWQPTTGGAIRIADDATELGDVEIPAGTRVFGSFIFASRDEHVYPTAADWSPARFVGDARQPEPLAFSGGRHRCLGDRLARIELEELAKAFIEHAPRNGWDFGTEFEWLNFLSPRRPTRLVANARS